MVYTRRRVAVFVDGCFWHRCPEHGRHPSDPTGYWARKFERNVERDRAVSAALQEAGWKVVRVWEHQTVDEAVTLVEQALGREPAV